MYCICILPRGVLGNYDQLNFGTDFLLEEEKRYRVGYRLEWLTVGVRTGKWRRREDSGFDKDWHSTGEKQAEIKTRVLLLRQA